MSSRPLLILVTLVVLAHQVLAFYDKEAYKAQVYNDNSNDDAVGLTAQQLIVRSGFSYELYYSIADDGYVTQLIRIINKLADRSKLKKPPVLLFHGASIDQSAYLAASSKQHKPEKYPRNYTVDGPITSSNRSLGFFLANHGFDVWLIGQRGSNKGNQGFVKNVTAARANYANFTLTAENYEYVTLQREQYFLYGLDDVIAYELREQLDRVRNLTGIQEQIVFTYSLSTPTTMAFYAANPSYANRTRLYIQQAPPIPADHFTAFGKAFFEVFDQAQPTAGVGFIALPYGQDMLRAAILALSVTPETKYTAVYEIFSQLFGPALVYQTNLELNLVSRIFQDVSHKTIQQYSQCSVSKKFNMYDYGLVGNLARYNQTFPPEYNVTRLEVQYYVVIDGSYDSLADQTTTQRIVERTSSPRPIIHLTAPGYNHLDFIGGVENARYVNFPILAQMNAVAY